KSSLEEIISNASTEISSKYVKYACNASGNNISSAPKNIIHLPFAWRIPLFQASYTPLSFSDTEKSMISLFFLMISKVESLEFPSINSNSVRKSFCERILFRQRCKKGSALYVAMIIVIVGLFIYYKLDISIVVFFILI